MILTAIRHGASPYAVDAAKYPGQRLTAYSGRKGIHGDAMLMTLSDKSGKLAVIYWAFHRNGKSLSHRLGE